MTARPDEPHIGLVVEGVGEREAVPVLLRKHLHSNQDFTEVLGKPVPANGKGNATKEGGLEGYVAVAAARPGCQSVMCFFDSDRDCAATQGPEWLARVQAVVGIPVVIVLAEPNFEQWIYASAETLDLGVNYDQTARGLSVVSGALKPVKYVKPTWQPRLTQRMDLSIASGRAPSLARALDRFDNLRSLLI